MIPQRVAVWRRIVGDNNNGLEGSGAFLSPDCGVRAVHGPSSIDLSTETTVPASPLVDQPMFWVFNLENGSGDTVTFSACSVIMTNGDYTFSSPENFACYAKVAPNASVRFSTGAVWIPIDAPSGAYTYSLTVLDPDGDEIGCWQGKIGINGGQREDDDACSPGVLTATTETWVPVKPVTGQGSYLVVQGQNTGTTTNNAYQCNVTLTQGSYSYGSNGLIACWTGPVKAGAGFRVQTAAVWVPTNAPVGQYTTQIQAYNLAGAPVGCWTGTAMITKSK